MSGTDSTPEEPGLTVALDIPSARILADQAAVIQDLQFVMDACMRLLTALAAPAENQDEVVPLALWSSALVAYGRCFSGGDGSGLTTEDLEKLSLQGAVTKFHEWILGERDKLTHPAADPFEAAKIGAALATPGQHQQVNGIEVFTTNRVLIDANGVRQLGGLASELAKQTAIKAQIQQNSVLREAQKLDVASVYELPQLNAQPPAADATA